MNTTLALKHFKTIDPIMARLFAQSLKGPAPITIPKAKKTGDYFSIIVRAIISQQISVKAASAVRGRVIERVGTLTPENVLLCTHEELRSCGLSTQKTKYILYNAEHWHEIPFGNFVHLTDEDVITELTRLYGVGRWTAEMFLMSSMARPNVFSYGDLGLMQSIYRNYQFKPHYTKKIATVVDSWSPHKTLASLALWHQKDNDPLSK